MNCLIVGTGDMAHALALQYTKTTKDEKLQKLKIASATRQYVPGSMFHDLAPFVDLDGGLLYADLIILAIPGQSMVAFVEKHADHMQNKIVIDINNDAFTYEQEVFNRYNLNWVKGLNDCGAVDLLSRKSKSKPKTRLSGSDAVTVIAAKQFVENALGFDVTVVEHGGRKSDEQESIGKEWKHAAYVAILLYVIFMTIYCIHYYLKWPFEMDPVGFPNGTQNKVNASVAVGCFALSVMPGTYTRMVKAWKSDSMYVLHPNLIWALNIRKHVGLIGMFFLFVHAIMSLVDFSPKKYYWCMYASKDAEKMDIVGEVSMMFAIYSFALYIIIALSSMPGINEAMNKAQWDFVFGPVCWAALAFAHVHYCVIFFTKIRGTLELYGGIPHATVLASILPWIAFILKFIQMIFCRVVSPSRRDELNTTQHSGYFRKDSVSEKTTHTSRKDVEVEMCSDEA